MRCAGTNWPGGDRLTEVVCIVAPAVAAVNANVAARPVKRRNRRHGRRCLINGPDRNIRRTSGTSRDQRDERYACGQQLFHRHDPLPFVNSNCQTALSTRTECTTESVCLAVTDLRQRRVN